MVSVDAICGELARIAPLKLAEPWDNVGLLVGDRSHPVKRVMTCLTISEPIVAEVLAESVDLVITHHPLPFKPLQKLISDQTASGLLLKLIRAGTSVYSAHTAYDSARQGINQLWAEALQLTDIRPLVECSDEQRAGLGETEVHALGSGRFGDLANAMSMSRLLRTAAVIGQSARPPQFVGDPDRPIRRVAVACGSGGGFLAAAKRRGCEAMLTGEATFHVCLEAESLGIALGLLGHYASERFAMDRLAMQLSKSLPDLEIWSSRLERDPIRFLQ